jgi:hypothetical protein
MRNPGAHSRMSAVPSPLPEQAKAAKKAKVAKIAKATRGRGTVRNLSDLLTCPPLSLRRIGRLHQVDRLQVIPYAAKN